MTSYNTSSIYTLWRTVTRLLTEATFPTTTLNAGDPVAVWLGDYDLPPEDEQLSSERVVVAPFVVTPDVDWGPTGNGAREEMYDAFVYAITAVPGQDTLAALARLEALTTVVEATVRTISATAISGLTPTEFHKYGTQAQVAVGHVLPNVASTPNGAVGRAEIVLRCKFRINTPPVA